jgi:hypothetical protein
VIPANYDWRKGWENANIGWYEYHVKFNDAVSIKELMERGEEIVVWLYKNIENTERHARWAPYNPYNVGMRVKFRFEKDAVLFALRWL